MLAHIEKIESGCLARFEREFNFPQTVIWSYLTDNAKLKTWFPELSIEKLEKGERIIFNSDGKVKELEIIEVHLNDLLEFTWGDHIVRYELKPKDNGCQLILIEKFRTITEQTPIDLAGWHVCLEVIAALLNGSSIESRDKDWEKWYEIYKTTIKS